MNIDSLRAYCLSFRDTSEKLQWDDELCFKTGGRIFVMLGLDNPRLCFKCTPEVFAELIERENVRPAPYQSFPNESPCCPRHGDEVRAIFGCH